MKKTDKLILIIFILFLCNISVHASGSNNQSYISRYKISDTITLNDFLYAKEAPKNWKHLGINKNGDVIYRGKVIISNCGMPINADTASESYLFLKILLIAGGARPKQNCNTADTYKNGIYGLGCYTFESDK